MIKELEEEEYEERMEEVIEFEDEDMIDDWFSGNDPVKEEP